MDNFARNVKYLRVRHGLNQSEAAKIVTMTRTAWSEYEHGWSKPRFADLLAIAEYFDVSLTELVEMDLEKLNPNDILEFRKMVKKLNPNLNLSLNPLLENDQAKTSVKKANKELNPAVLEQLNKMEREIKRMRSKLGG